MKLCCQIAQDKALLFAEKLVKFSYYPIIDCVEICNENEHLEAAFILNKKLGKYYDCVYIGI